MHLADGTISLPVLASGGVAAIAAIAVGLRRTSYTAVPRVGVMAAVFFVASLIHVPIGIGKTHLILNGLAGILLGWAAVPALAAGFLLQSLFFKYGGISTLGCNIVNAAIPALVCHFLFTPLLQRCQARRSCLLIGFSAGLTGVTLTCLCMSLTLYTSNQDFALTAKALLLAHIPVAIVEGCVVAATVAFLNQVRPDFFRATAVSPALDGIT